MSETRRKAAASRRSRGSHVKGWARWHRQLGGGDSVKIKHPEKYLNSAQRGKP